MVQAVHGLRPGDLPALYTVQGTGDPEEGRKKDDAGHLRKHVQLQDPVEGHELDQEDQKMDITAIYAEEGSNRRKIVPVCQAFWRCPQMISALFPDVLMWMEKNMDPFEIVCLNPDPEPGCCFKRYEATEEELEWAPAKVKKLEREKDLLHKRISELEESR